MNNNFNYAGGGFPQKNQYLELNAISFNISEVMTEQKSLYEKYKKKICELK